MKPGNLAEAKVPNPAAKRKMRILNVISALRIWSERIFLVLGILRRGAPCDMK